ncbi:unnamed protein product [Rotaria socialis]|uniref:RRM domain-containing protein n=1 Tax=Rotaria socialis TaxID=392032 RepID=A0A820MQJ1_9BILA|nr:unnamed protein product [Rotaria socialis]CAF4376383.1 unnamed protein product [Rotaria socialis]CAF4857119.1 unnamed protein product [Rotaria socialis]
MDDSFFKISFPSDSGLCENNDLVHSSIFPSLCSSLVHDKISNINNGLENNCFFPDDYKCSKLSTMIRWQSDAENLNANSNSSNQEMSIAESYLPDDFCIKKTVPSASVLDDLISPMSRLSTSSSVMSFNSLGNYKVPQQLPSGPAITNSSDQLIVPNESANIFPSVSSFQPLPNRQTLSSIDNIQLPKSDHDLQRVPPSFMLMQPTSSYVNRSILCPQPPPQVVHSTTRSNTMPNWRGHLPMQHEAVTIDEYQITASFSRKVFLGGIPAELSEAELLLVLRKFGKCNIKWPKNDGNNHNTPGFCHLVYRDARSVGELLKHCTRQQRATVDYFLHIHMLPSSTLDDFSARTTRFKPIQVVPWNMKDNVYAVQQKNVRHHEPSYKDWSRTIFVSPLHGKMTAFSLDTIMSNVFGAVSITQINTDKYGYPTGTGTVLFYDSHSYMRAVAAGTIDIKCDCFHKLLDIDPFLRENEPCTFCPSIADAFCRNFHCLRSYCKQCWVQKHGPKSLAGHQPVTRREQIF